VSQCYKKSSYNLQEIFSWTFMVQEKIIEADTLTIWLGATPSGLNSNPPPSPPHFYARCPSCHNPPTLSWLGTGTKYAGLHTQWRGLFIMAAIFNDYYYQLINQLIH